MLSCVDLQKTFGSAYLIGRDVAFFAEFGANARTRDPWYWQILCKNGHIYPHGGQLLGASTDRHGAIANRLRVVAGVEVVQDGSDGINVVFPIECFETVATILKARKRRKLAPAHRRTLAAAGAVALERYRNFNADSRPGGRDPKPSVDFQLAC